MVLRDKVYICSYQEVQDEYGGSQVTFVRVKPIMCNVRIFFSQNEDGLQNRQGLPHLEGSLITRDEITTKYIEYDNHYYQIMVKNPQAKQYAYKFREVRNA